MADFYLGGPYHDGTYSICEVATGRVRHVFNPATDDHHVEGDKYNSRGVNTRNGVPLASGVKVDAPAKPAWCYAHGGPMGSAGQLCVCGRAAGVKGTGS